MDDRTTVVEELWLPGRACDAGLGRPTALLSAKVPKQIEDKVIELAQRRPKGEQSPNLMATDLIVFALERLGHLLPR